jgi:hypothetical protein
MRTARSYRYAPTVRRTSTHLADEPSQTANPRRTHHAATQPPHATRHRVDRGALDARDDRTRPHGSVGTPTAHHNPQHDIPRAFRSHTQPHRHARTHTHAHTHTRSRTHTPAAINKRESHHPSPLGPSGRAPPAAGPWRPPLGLHTKQGLCTRRRWRQVRTQCVRAPPSATQSKKAASTD